MGLSDLKSGIQLEGQVQSCWSMTTKIIWCCSLLTQRVSTTRSSLSEALHFSLLFGFTVSPLVDVSSLIMNSWSFYLRIKHQNIPWNVSVKRWISFKYHQCSTGEHMFCGNDVSAQGNQVNLHDRNGRPMTSSAVGWWRETRGMVDQNVGTSLQQLHVWVEKSFPSQDISHIISVSNVKIFYTDLVNQKFRRGERHTVLNVSTRHIEVTWHTILHVNTVVSNCLQEWATSSFRYDAHTTQSAVSQTPPLVLCWWHPPTGSWTYTGSIAIHTSRIYFSLTTGSYDPIFRQW